MSTPPCSTIDPIAAHRWAERAPAATPWLHEEVARRMAERLAVIRLPVNRWAHWEPPRSGWQGHALVVERYPQAEALQVMQHPVPERDAAPARAGWWQRVGRKRAASAQVVSAPPDGTMQLVWANMLAHQGADPEQLLARWHRALAVDGFLMFSCLGPDTLQELRALYARLGWPPPAQEFTDMHDWGDQLLEAGFADPVMDMEHITLSFETPARLLAELRDSDATSMWRASAPCARRPGAGNSKGRSTAPAPGPQRAAVAELRDRLRACRQARSRHTVAARTEISLEHMKASLRQRNRNLPPLRKVKPFLEWSTLVRHAGSSCLHGVFRGVVALLESSTYRFARMDNQALAWHLRRNCSVTPRQLGALYASLCLVTVVISLWFWAIGAKMVLGFAGLELLLVGVAFLVYARHAVDGETVSLQDGSLIVERESGGDGSD